MFLSAKQGQRGGGGKDGENVADRESRPGEFPSKGEGKGLIVMKRRERTEK